MTLNKLKSMQDSLLEYVVFNFTHIFYERKNGQFEIHYNLVTCIIYSCIFRHISTALL